MTTSTRNSTRTSTVIVHGASGTQGAAIAARLRAAGHTVRPVDRRVLLDPAALADAYAGADAVVVQLPLDFGPTARDRAEAILGALGKAAVPRVVFNTAAGVPPTEPIGIPFVDARARLAAGLPAAVESASVVGPAGPYLENLSAAWSRSLVLGGEVRYPLPAEAPIPWLAAADLGTAIAELLAADRPAAARVVAGPAALTGPELAAELEAALGRPVRWRTITPGEYRAMLEPHLGPEAAAGIAAAYEHPAPPPDPALVAPGVTAARTWAGSALAG